MSQVLALHDHALLTLAANNKSGVEMQEETGVPAAQAILRVRQLLSDKDVWTEEERKKLLLESLYSLKERIEGVIDHADPKSVGSYLATLKTIGDRLDAASQINEKALEKITRTQAMLLLSVFSVATDRAKEILSLTHPDALMDEIDAALRVGLLEAAQVVEVTYGAE